jgi:acetyltransferase
VTGRSPNPSIQTGRTTTGAGAPGVPESFPIGSGHTVTIRAAEPGDEAALATLYQQLSPADRHRRFFSAYQPSADLLHDWVHVADEGGFRLVAVLDGGRIVGDTGFFRDHEGSPDAEFDITVEDDERGWLGPFLLDTLVNIAAAQGIETLRAEVLVENGPMMSVIHARGWVNDGHEDRTTVTLLIGTGDAVAHWPESSAGHDRVLVESPSGDWHGAESLRSFGAEVVVCPGPGRRRQPHCPVLQGGRCPLVEVADAVVFDLPLDDPDARTVLTDHLTHPGLVVCRERPSDDLAPDPSDRHVVRLAAGDPLVAEAVLEAIHETPTELPRRRGSGDRSNPPGAGRPASGRDREEPVR